MSGAAGGRSLLRRNLAPVLVALGAFLLTLAVLLNTYVYGTLAMLPGDTEAEWRLEDESATYLDTATWRTAKKAAVAQRTEVRGSTAPGNSRWSTWEVSVDTVAADRMIGHMDRRVIVDRSTGLAVNCCGEHVDGDRAVRQAGLVRQWPAGGSAGDHPFYDADLRAAPMMRFDGTENVAGVSARRYVQEVAATQVPGSARAVPAHALGGRGNGTVQATRWLEVTRTLWVEPVTGRVVNAEEQRTETLRAEGGRGRDRVLLDADLAMPDFQVKAAAEQAESHALRLRLTGSWLPMGLGGLGGAVALAGLAVAFARRGRGQGREGREGRESQEGPSTQSGRDAAPAAEPVAESPEQQPG
ncbi:Protein of unknown function (DUF3068) [Murinocardiopsis flavida]|uniref:DUF3068 family protein n=1 Tax=Murinocardiopsis flavida TaxID=645275 RepID=A0A2P8DIV6_9ACTN|nr:DUF3068 domain-containing protein [Murinocardiopsis flavida]PSK97162.1 Protein of unknown function (DUF3068) [Murinocardiopsis flavida]